MKRHNFWIWFFAILSTLFISIILFITYALGINIHNEIRGTFGDMFGAANALFTGLSFVALIVTILLQRKDLKHQQYQLEIQNQSNLIQNFETTFFNMINVHHQIINSLHLEHTIKKDNTEKVVIEKERKVFLYLFGKINNQMNGDGEKFSNIYTNYYMPLNFHLEHYYNNFFQILKYIDESKNINQLLKNRYSMILSSQLSEHEKLMIFYHIIYINDQGNFKRLIEKYNLLDNFNYSFRVPVILAQKYNPGS
ncbi:putative phage abortive infection protein [Chryseobacterium gambrini]|uniref:Putative phage abortive infection protein n=1 Tax=Chryseobacterium gambrini TaxID=373672 RepID=A0A1N7MKV5_9FLAO|nr:putative phage abortive infection protein [Chryseobacterium gambrini]SIS86628.1 Putative phage abortive infection protein [Chryseobacterium gambrini]